MQEASRETVLGDFDGAQFTHGGSTSRFFSSNGKFFVNTEGPDGAPADFEITYTFGVAPLQQYLVEFPGGRLQCLQVAWDVERSRWFQLQPDQRIEPGDPFHWTGRYQNWNSRCADCHSTGLRKNYDAANDAYQTQWHDIDVGCQSCHGPGSAHVEWAQNERRVVSGDGHVGLPVGFDAKNPTREVEACAPCHSRRHRVGRDDQPGRSLMDDYMVSTLREGLYHADGQILDEVYDYGSFVQSKMYHRGVRCSDCHDPHSLKLIAQGNDVCVQCHQPSGDARFPTLPHTLYDSPDHHFHPMGSAGARCTACHMPETTYMMIDARADHSLRIPRPDLTVKIGVPNACTGCHADRPAQWAADAITRWYGNGRRRERHYGETLAAARAGDPRAFNEIENLALDTDQPVIVRATALELLPQYGEKAQRAIAASTTSPEPLIRATAVGSLDGLPPDRLAQAAIPLLDDSVRAVRIEAVRVLSGVPVEYFDARARLRFDAAIVEYTELQMAEAETPGAHLNLAVIHAAAGRYDLAETEYLTALKIDATFVPALVNLANLYDQRGRTGEAEAMFRTALDRAQPADKGELYYSLGLLLAQENRMKEAAGYLGRASEALPTRARVRYNYALALQHLGRRAEAESAMKDALATDPSAPDIVNAMAVFYVQQGEWERALPHAERLVELLPGAPEPARLLGHIREQVATAPDGVK
jgi:tetratricopeptide (TPR) repeat protein